MEAKINKNGDLNIKRNGAYREAAVSIIEKNIAVIGALAFTRPCLENADEP